MRRNIVVMGGSFNPPTLAHYRLMRSAIDALNADIGFFVPVSDAYLRRKMRSVGRPVVLSPDMRVDMLQAICCDEPRMEVCCKEIGTVEARTVPTLLSLRDDYPDAELYFIMGADKLNLLAHLTEKSDFLGMFRVVLFSREQVAIEEELNKRSIFSAHRHRIVVLPQPQGTEEISSSLIRERFLAGESCNELLHTGVWDIFQGLRPDDFPEVIKSFKDEYAFLSNKYPCSFVWQGREYGSVDEAFKPFKSERNIEVMEEMLVAKFRQNPPLMKLLRETKQASLIYGNNKKDSFWGVDLYTWRGENNLGKILMKIREKEEIL